MSGGTLLVLLRHGEAEGNRDLRYLGSTDVPLTADGERQARQLAASLGRYPLAALYTSPLLRARRTAEAIALALGLDVIVEPALREQSYGVWENRTRAEVQAEEPELLAAWERGELAPPGGETLDATRERVVTLADRLAVSAAGKMLALVSHVGPIKALVAAALELPSVGAYRMWLDTASVSVIEWRAGEGKPSSGILRVFNDTVHLDPPARWLRS